ncbi:MAG TPA: UDP-N-acetyl glucosamine 2-epimerase [Bdellovibrionota bacterium]|nr:UDP-N-acetyl glucosamine 2-epimerase [Bdellovibrionota bacterium]
MKTIVTITGIRPDFIRMKEIFRRLDENFRHIMIHTGQHYDDALSKVFFEDLKIRKPDHVLATGANSRTHYEQLAYLSKEIFYLFEREKIDPDLILFLGDSNSAMISAPLFKEGYRIGHIEGGMRSYDRRMPEEVNRVICDYVSDFIFVYTPAYKERLLKENRPPDGIFVVGNTITEIVREFMPKGPRAKKYIVGDIHRSENLSSPEQLRHILEYLNSVGEALNIPVKLVRFARAQKMIEENHLLDRLSNIEPVGPYGFLKYLEFQYGALAVISDSGTAQEECPLLGVPAIVPRNRTERPESLEFGNSILVGESRPIPEMVRDTLEFIKSYTINEERLQWLGDGKTSERIVSILLEKLK